MGLRSDLHTLLSYPLGLLPLRCYPAPAPTPRLPLRSVQFRIAKRDSICELHSCSASRASLSSRCRCPGQGCSEARIEIHSRSMPAREAAGARREVMGGLAKGLFVLRALGRESRGLTLSEVAGIAQLPPATARRCLHTLEELGYVTRAG